MKKLNILMIALIAMILTSCGDKKETTNPNPSTPNEIITSTTWKADGFYAKGQKVPHSTPNLQLKFSSGVIKTININGNTTAPATWSLSNDGKLLTINYPDGYADGKVTAAQKELEVRVSKEELVFINTSDKPIELLGIFSLPAKYEMKFIPQSATPSEANDVTSDELTKGTWTANKDGAGFFVKGNTGTSGTKANITFKFRTVFGLNTLTVGGIPTPTTWSLNADKSVLTLKIPNKEGFTEKQLNVKITADQLTFTADKTFTLYSVLKFDTTNELRMLQQ